MARRQHKNSISLFPFLAVLVCTMGALILLLLVTTRKIRHDQLDASSRTEPESRSQPEIVEMPVAEASPDHAAIHAEELAELNSQIVALRQSTSTRQAEIEALMSGIEAAQSKVASLSSLLAVCQSEVDAVQEERKKPPETELVQVSQDLMVQVERQSQQLDQVAQNLLKKQQQLYSLREEKERSSVALHEQRSALVSLRKQVDSQQQMSVASGGVKTLVEFSNSTGTTRTPIVIDVSDSGYELLPLGIRITGRDMEGFPLKDNPLLSAVLASHRCRSDGSVVSAPYVLLLVRPDGCLPFYGAQRVLSEAGIHYGYELLTPERTINAGEPDESEVRTVRAAILESLNRRETLYAALRADATSRIAGGEQPREVTRRLILRSDGRVITAEDGDERPLEGRFYAGGEALPRDFVRKIPSRSVRSPDPKPGSDDHWDEENGNEQNPAAADEVAGYAAVMAPQSASPQSAASQALPSQAAAEESANSVTESRHAPSFLDSEITRKSPSASPPPRAEWQPESLIRDDLPPTPFDAGKQHSSDASLLAQWMESDGDRSQRPGSGRPAGGNNSEPSAAGSASGSESHGDGGSGASADLSKVDPEVLEQLKKYSRFSQDAATPVGITVFLDPSHMTIGQQPTIPVTSETMNNAFAKLLLAISEEVAAVRGQSDTPMMPVVKFVVSPGGEQLRIPLARQLRRMGIHSVSVVEITPYITPDDDVGTARIDDTAVPDDVVRGTSAKRVSISSGQQSPKTNTSGIQIRRRRQ